MCAELLLVLFGIYLLLRWLRKAARTYGRTEDEPALTFTILDEINRRLRR